MSGTWCDYFVLGVSGEKSNWPIELVYFGLRVSPSLSLVWDLSEISEGHVGWTEINAWLSVQETNIQHQSQPSEQPSVLAVSDVTHQISIIISLAIRPGSQWVSSMNRNGMGILELLTGSWNNEHTLIVHWYYLEDPVWLIQMFLKLLPAINGLHNTVTTNHLGFHWNSRNTKVRDNYNYTFHKTRVSVCDINCIN